MEFGFNGARASAEFTGFVISMSHLRQNKVDEDIDLPVVAMEVQCLRPTGTGLLDLCLIA